MTNDERIALFPELDLISNVEIYHFALFCIENMPEYFFHIPASSSGKYHPSYALGEGGLVRHTRAAMNIFYSFASPGVTSWYQQDCLVTNADFLDAGLLALLVHDSFKSGPPDSSSSELPPNAHTVHEHPLLASDFLLMALQKYRELRNASFPPEAIMIVESAANAVVTHMGRWTVSKHSSLVLPSPVIGDWLCKLVHLADHLASRKMLDFNFKALERDINV